jgi:hypothetical protein
MTNSQQYIPKKGDQVTALGQNGMFEVVDLYEDSHSADLKLVGPEVQPEAYPVGSINPRKEEDPRGH